MSKIWQYIAAGFAALASILGAAFLIVVNQRDRAREAAQDAKDGLKAVKSTQSKERDITKAQNQARTEAQEVERDQMAQKQSGTRPREFGDVRMHDDQDSDGQP